MIYDLLSTKYAVRPNIKGPNKKIKNYVKGKEERTHSEREEEQTIIINFSYLEGRRTQIP